MADMTANEHRRQRKARQTREALAAAAMELVLAHGLDGVTVEAIAERADVTRRTFSRHFSGKEEAALDFVRSDVDRINRALRARPSGESPLLAYRRAVADWLRDPELPGWGGSAAPMFVLVDREPSMFAAFERVRVEAQAESVRILAERLGVDPERDLRPATVVGAAAGVLTAALRVWARGGRQGEEPLPDLMERAYSTLTAEAEHAESGQRDQPPPHPTDPPGDRQHRQHHHGK